MLECTSISFLPRTTPVWCLIDRSGSTNHSIILKNNDKPLLDQLIEGQMIEWMNRWMDGQSKRQTYREMDG